MVSFSTAPHTTAIYSSRDYKLDEGQNTPNTFNLHYEGCIFVGLYDTIAASNQVEPYPQGTSVVWPVKDIIEQIYYENACYSYFSSHSAEYFSITMY